MGAAASLAAASAVAMNRDSRNRWVGRVRAGIEGVLGPQPGERKMPSPF